MLPPIPNLFTPIASNYIYQRCLISNVTNAVNAIVTTSTANGFINGEVIRIIVPPAYGMVLNYVQTTIQVIDQFNFQTTIDTSALLPFVAPTFTPGHAFTPAQAVPMTGLEWNIAPLTGNQPPAVPTPPNTEILPHLPPVYPPAIY
jgi:hypothetical protein